MPRSWCGLPVSGRPFGQAAHVMGLGTGQAEVGSWEGEQNEPSNQTQAPPEQEPEVGGDLLGRGWPRWSTAGSPMGQHIHRKRG